MNTFGFNEEKNIYVYEGRLDHRPTNLAITKQLLGYV